MMLYDRRNGIMPPKFKFTRDEITDAALNATRKAGPGGLTAMAAGKYPPYKASGMAYIRFAREEKELFKLLFMRDRKGEPLKPGREMEVILPLIMKNTGLSREKAELFHLELWVFVHGIAAMIATSYLDYELETISEMLTDVYMGLKTRFCEGSGK